LVVDEDRWYIPGWMRTQEPRAEVMACVSNVFPNAKVEFKSSLK